MSVETSIIQPHEWLEALRAQGYRLTSAKVALLDTLSHSVFPLSAERAWELVRQERPSTGRATVYRLFEALEALGFLRRVHGIHHCNQYVLSQDSSRPLFVCMACGRAEFLPAEELSAYIEALSRKSGYRCCAAYIQLLGTCTNCTSLI